MFLRLQTASASEEARLLRTTPPVNFDADNGLNQGEIVGPHFESARCPWLRTVVAVAPLIPHPRVRLAGMVFIITRQAIQVICFLQEAYRKCSLDIIDMAALLFFFFMKFEPIKK